MNAPTRTPVEPQQTPAVRHCLHLIARVFDVHPTGFDWPKEYCPDCGGVLPNGCGCS